MAGRHRRSKLTLTVWWRNNCAWFLAASYGWLDDDGRWQRHNPLEIPWTSWSAARAERCG